MPVLASAQVYGKTATGVDAAIGATTPTASTGVLTFSGQPANGETITVGPFTYRWTNVSANATGQVPYYVLIGANTAASITNLAAAINGVANRGVTFSNLTVPNPLATAVATSGTVLTVTATNPGADGNGFSTTSATANATWGATTSTGGISASLNVTATVTPSGTQNVNLSQVGGAAVALGQAAAAASIPVVQPTASQTAACVAAVASGSTTASACNITFVASSDFVGTLLGQTFAAGASLTFRASQSNTIGAIAYTRSAGTLYIYTLT